MSVESSKSYGTEDLDILGLSASQNVSELSSPLTLNLPWTCGKFFFNPHQL